VRRGLPSEEGGLEINTRAAFSATILLVLAVASEAQQPAPQTSALSSADMAVIRKQEQDIVKVKPNLYMINGAGGNTTVLVTSAGILLVDTKDAGDNNYEKLMDAIRTVSNQPIKIAINSHYHGDHTGNNAQFIAAGVQVIGRSNMADRMQSPGPDGKAPPAAPNAPYSGDSDEVTLGKATVRILHLGDGHTDTDSVVYFPDKKAVSTGDLYVSITPAIDYRGGGTLLGTQKAVKALLKLDFDVAIPGHGLAPVSRAQIVKYETDLDKVVFRAEALIRQGVSKDHFMSEITSDDLGWNLSTPMWSGPRASASIYDELSAAIQH
jgi:glyoxylase-like metal-dependent hydrolase (beta-lactamase superfamily II)